MAYNSIFGQIGKRRNNQEQKFFEKSSDVIVQFMPLSFKLNSGDWWEFPIEPLISISGKNIIKKRNVAKSTGRGTIKERWAQDDMAISIQGSLVGVDDWLYPEEQLTELYNIIKQGKSIEVQNELLQLLDIHHIVVESYSFPFSKGENVQNFSLSGYSDDITNLFITANDV